MGEYYKGMEEKMKKVMVIDDDTEFTTRLAQKLKDVRLEPVVMLSGKEALDYLEVHNDIDFIILDFIMPNMDGYTFSHVLTHDLRKNIPTVVLTNFPETEKGEEGLEVYVKNETDLDVFVQKIKQRLSF